jgi:hypothetical protein
MVKVVNLGPASPRDRMWIRMPNADRTLQAEQTYFSSKICEDSPKFFDQDTDSAKLKTQDRLPLVAKKLEKVREQQLQQQLELCVKALQQTWRHKKRKREETDQPEQKKTSSFGVLCGSVA